MKRQEIMAHAMKNLGAPVVPDTLEELEPDTWYPIFAFIPFIKAGYEVNIDGLSYSLKELKECPYKKLRFCHMHAHYPKTMMCAYFK